ncbi:bifunctional DNA-formamidopyrimidine glycosylase/DNA-(apurinic or apyrimidinic site) lyase [Blastomonas fulva]|uniref:Formamidopyrimidine-DNA glycosylase n=1 Tax=Blastomonas fulva TaxID=1550728 RepID=A0ABN5B549_9SPHN|nr:bifunctional DNA-formamidopyrimidine glycosylase/DNA-(apurinic or apyrimidinic site) lyase [Blastomonas fulva]ASR51296.1 DNA-formamidopyrimidine glycosylase [Blastomonas fulva]
MPELPEVETTVRGLAAVLQDVRLTSVVARRADLRRAFPVDLGQRMTGARIISLGRRAKYGLIETDRGDSMIFHLGMSGRWRIDPEDIGTHDHLVMHTDSGHVLSLFDPRRFGSVDLVETAAIASFPSFAAMGPEPLGDDFTPAYLLERLKGRASPIKAMLLDQRIVAGLGNIYVCEALNMARISPLRAAGQIGPAKLKPLVTAIKSVLVDAIAAGGSTLRDYARPDGQLGYFAKQWRVYGREGEACPCGGTVKRTVQSGRSTFWCPSCQK